MKVINIHKRRINQPKSVIEGLFQTLATDNDMMLANDKWPRMRLDKGLKVGSKGGHGPIRYTVEAYQIDDMIQFSFTRPEGFNGFHRFDIVEIDSKNTEIKHIIDMNTSFMATLKWSLAIRWLHDAFIEDAFDKVENHFLNEKKHTKWNIWVKFLRSVLK